MAKWNIHEFRVHKWNKMSNDVDMSNAKIKKLTLWAKIHANEFNFTDQTKT